MTGEGGGGGSGTILTTSGMDGVRMPKALQKKGRRCMITEGLRGIRSDLIEREFVPNLCIYPPTLFAHTFVIPASRLAKSTVS